MVLEFLGGRERKKEMRWKRRVFTDHVNVGIESHRSYDLLQ